MGSIYKPITYDINEKGCHNCTSHKLNTQGYPMRNNHTMVHWLYVQKFGEIPKGLVMRHICDNPLCVNVDHIILGTHKDNSQDMVERGRQAKGEKNGRAKLTWDSVREIRADKITSNRALAKSLGVDTELVRLIRLNRIWKE